MGLLWKSDERPEDNLSQASIATEKLVKRPERCEQRKLYEDLLLRDYSRLKAIEVQPDPTSNGFYMPHHAVIRDRASTTITRVVFKASAGSDSSVSLNDTLNPGPSLLPDLLKLLLHFVHFLLQFK